MVIRNFLWKHISAVVELESQILQGEGSSIDDVKQSVEEYLLQPNLDVENNLFMYEDHGNLAGLAIVCPEPSIKRSVLILKIHPDYQCKNVQGTLIDIALKRASYLGASVLHIQVADNQFLTNILMNAGFKYVRTYWTMRWDLQPLHSTAIPTKYSFRPYGRRGDAEILTKIQNDAFSGSWGFAPNSPEEIEYRANMGITSHEGIIFLNEGTNVRGYCWTYILGSGKEKVGVISMIGIDPKFRQRGLGKPLLEAGLKHLSSRNVSQVELEVDSNNTAATKLYISMGFTKVGDRHWFEASPIPNLPNVPPS